jgi:aryl-alcohol dehydrogenase
MNGEECCTTEAAVCETGMEPLAFVSLHLDPPRPDEVLIRMVASGICHTDVAMRKSDRVCKPVVLGHEGAGIVEAIGAGVRKVKVGDHVVMTFASCGQCSSCVRGVPAYCRHTAALNFGARRLDGTSALRRGSTPIGSHYFGQSSFATRSICYERNVVVVPRDLPLPSLAPLGCGIQTGAGAVLNSLAVRAGQTVAIIGVGAVGLASVMAAKISGASSIIAADIHAERLSLARELGATHLIDTRDGRIAEALASIVPDGLDALIDTSGHVETIVAALNALAPMGRCGLISSAQGKSIPVSPGHLMAGGRSITGIQQGDSVPDFFIPKLIAYQRQGRFPFERLLHFYPFSEINEAFSDLARGAVLKPVVLMPGVHGSGI